MRRNRYSFSEIVSTIYSLVLTKLTVRNARLIRRPVYLRGRKSLVGGKGLTTGRFCRFDLNGTKKTLFIGDNCEMGDLTHLVAHERVEIGDNVLIASKCFISDTSHGNYKDEAQDAPDIPPNQRRLVTKAVRIGNNVWIGENAVILPGADIGDGCIIGANSIVSKRIERNSMVAGAGRIIKQFDHARKEWVPVEKARG